MNSILPIAQKFVEHMDQGDLETARTFLHPDCHYSIRGEEFKGPDAIIGSYQSNSDSVSSQLDETIFKSNLVEMGVGHFRVEYLDIVKKNGETHEHRCNQYFWFEGEKIIKLVHEDLDGEVEALENFFKRHGVVRKKS